VKREGLMSYGPDIVDLERTDLRGENSKGPKPGDRPVEQAKNSSWSST
jgi:hypothetical protein